MTKLLQKLKWLILPTIYQVLLSTLTICENTILTKMLYVGDENANKHLLSTHCVQLDILYNILFLLLGKTEALKS